jgi:hypothetical protein
MQSVLDQRLVRQGLRLQNIELLTTVMLVLCCVPPTLLAERESSAPGAPKNFPKGSAYGPWPRNETSKNLEDYHRFSCFPPKETLICLKLGNQRQALFLGSGSAFGVGTIARTGCSTAAGVHGANA